MAVDGVMLPPLVAVAVHRHRCRRNRPAELSAVGLRNSSCCAVMDMFLPPMEPRSQGTGVAAHAAHGTAYGPVASFL